MKIVLVDEPKIVGTLTHTSAESERNHSKKANSVLLVVQKYKKI